MFKYNKSVAVEFLQVLYPKIQALGKKLEDDTKAMESSLVLKTEYDRLKKEIASIKKEVPGIGSALLEWQGYLLMAKLHECGFGWCSGCKQLLSDSRFTWMIRSWIYNERDYYHYVEHDWMYQYGHVCTDCQIAIGRKEGVVHPASVETRDDRWGILCSGTNVWFNADYILQGAFFEIPDGRYRGKYNRHWENGMFETSELFESLWQQYCGQQFPPFRWDEKWLDWEQK